MIRLDCLLSNRGYCYRSRTKEYLKAVEVTVDGVRQLQPSAKVDATKVRVEGEELDPEIVWILMHKPMDAICSHKEEGLLIYDLLPDRWMARKPQITSVGRLDRDTTGLILLSDDGPRVHRLTTPKHHVPRVYLATLKNPIEGHEAGVFKSGSLMLEKEDKPLLPAEMETVDKHTARLTLYEGRYHQVKRMFEALGNEVTALHREKFGTIELGDLKPREWRLLTKEEVEKLG